MLSLVAVLPDAAVRNAVGDALGPAVRLRYCRSLSEAEALALREAPCALLLQADADGTTLAGAGLERLRRQLSATPVIVLRHDGRPSAHEVVALVKAGADEVIDLATLRDPRRLQAIHVSAWRYRLRDGLAARVTPEVWRVVAPVVSHCLTTTERAPSVASVGRALSTPVRTLTNRHRAVGTLSPGAVVSWCRLLVAVRFLADRGRSVEHVAYALGFGDGPGLRNMLRRYTTLRPSELRCSGGAARVLELCATALGSRAGLARRGEVVES